MLTLFLPMQCTQILCLEVASRKNYFPFTGQRMFKGVFCTRSKQKPSKRNYSYNSSNATSFQISWMGSHSLLWNQNILGLERNKCLALRQMIGNTVSYRHPRTISETTQWELFQQLKENIIKLVIPLPKSLHDWAKTIHSVLAQTCSMTTRCHFLLP